MRHRFFIITAFILCVSLSAADIKDTWFKTFYDATAEKIPQGCQLRQDAAKRIIFLDMPLPIKSDQSFNLPAAKAAIVKAIKGSPDADFIKKAEIIVIYNYITTDYKINSVVITGKDL